MKYLLLTLPLMAISPSALAKTEADYELTAEAGAVYNSELVVDEIDQRSSSGDMARYLSLDLGGDWVIEDRFNIKAGYNVSDTDYQDSDDFDLTIHRFYGDVSYDFSAVTVGASQHEIDAKLAGDSFLDMSRGSFYLSKLFNNSIFVRAETIRIDKSFDTLPQRDATNDALGVDSYFFYNQGNSFFSLGYSAEEERAASPEFSYDGDNYRATLSNKFGHDNNHRLQLQWRYFDRDYRADFPSIRKVRNDSRNTLRLAWDYYFTPQYSLVTQLENTESSSNFETADYTANEISLLFKVEL
ncbi:hypothetical protein [Kangiella shandongensis]|uniref:hypothetical protein n=1 Tax=Kangiella shandongensis TaxID=2763258 RepID=UPI001CC0AEF1|nr:hypothetical protein [Kangiella shandongensis]